MAEPGTPTSPVADELEEVATIKQLAVTGVATTFGRSVGVRAIGLLLNVFLARALAPEAFGQLALGFTIFTALSVFANAGLGASLIRRPEPPDADDLATVFAAQLTLSAVGVAVVAGLAIALATTPLILAALYLSAMPIQALRTSAIIQLERRLEYRRMAIIDVVDSASQALFAVALVLAGSGVYGVAAAQALGIVVGTTVLLSWRPAPLYRPRLNRGRARTLLADGALFGASDATNLARDLTLNWGTAAIAGLPILGIWSFTTRLAAIPTMAIQAVGHVAYSAVPRLHAAGGSARSAVIPTLRLTTAALGAPAALLAGCCPQFVPLIFGHDWASVSDVLPLTCLALLIAGPVSAASVGYLFAQGRVRRILGAQIAHSIVTVGIAFALLPSLGVAALGISICGAGLTDAAILGWATMRGADTGYLRATAPLVLVTVALGAAAFASARELEPTWVHLVLLAVATVGGYLLALRAVAREDARRLWRLLASSFTRPAAATP